MERRIGQFFRELFSGETVELATDTLEATFGLAEAIQKEDLQKILGSIV